MFSIIVIVLICTTILSFAAWQYANSFEYFSDTAALVGAISAVLSLVAGIILIFSTYSWYAAEYQAKIINREYNTQYTQEEVFFASDVIETVREIQRNRKEVTLNVNTEKKEK